MFRSTRFIVLAAVVFSLFACGADSASAQAQVSAEQQVELKELQQEFTEAQFSSKRRRAFSRMLRLDEPAIREALAFVEEQLDAQEEQYAKQLAEYLPGAYQKHLERLRDEQIYQVQKTRRMWQRYTLNPTDRHDFQDNYLAPCEEIKKFMLLDVQRVMNREIAKQRAVLTEYAGYRTDCRKELGLGADPTAQLKAPTGIDIPPLDHPMTFAERLAYLEASAVLAYTVACDYKGAHPILLNNAHTARLIDWEEADFALFANEVRMLVGSIGYEIDPLVCACTRDHSTDRKNGLASGHMSTVPGKRGFTHRLKRFGARGRSEGAGGGKNGRGYIWGLSYGGGHTHPLYGIRRNVHGCGRRGGVYTSIYYTKNELRHPCAATENELFMPPGWTDERITSQPLKQVYQAMQEDKFGKADELLPTKRERETQQEIIRRFFKVAIQMEADWAIECATKYIEAGDLYAAKLRLEQAKTDFAGADRYISKFDVMLRKLESGRRAAELEAGQAYYALSSDKPDPDTMKKFIDEHPKSVYAKAGQYYLDDVDKRDAFVYFWDQVRNLRKFEYHLPD